MAELSWALPYTIHLGYQPPAFRPQFLETAGSADPVVLVEHAKSIGVHGVLYPWALERPDEEVESVAAALHRTGLVNSALVATTLGATADGAWTATAGDTRAMLMGDVLRAATLAERLRCSMIVALVTHGTGVDESVDVADLLDAAAENLNSAASVAADFGVTIGVEPMVSLSSSAVRTIDDAVDLVDKVDRPNIGIVYDTAHVHAMHGDILEPYDRAERRVCLVQVADAPGRVEPGAGALPLAHFVHRAVSGGYASVIDFEHGWSSPALDRGRAGLSALQAFDAQVDRLLSDV